MVGILINKNYKYENVELQSGVKVNANQVTIMENKVVRINNGYATIKDGENTKNFNFSIDNHSINGEKTYTLSNVPEGIDGQAIVREFVDFVESDVA